MFLKDLEKEFVEKYWIHRTPLPLLHQGDVGPNFEKLYKAPQKKMKKRPESFTPSIGSVVEYSSQETEISCAQSLLLIRKMHPN